MSENEWDATAGHWEVDPARAMALIIGAVVVVIVFLVAATWFAVADNQTDADVDKRKADVEERIVAECAGEENPGRCVEQIREAL